MRIGKWHLLILFLAPSSVLGQYDNEPDGFRGLTWNSRPPGDFFLNPTESFLDEDIEYFENPHEKLSLGRFPIVSVIYDFHRKWGLVSGALHFSRNCDAIYELVETKFGKPTERPVWEVLGITSSNLSWKGSKTKLVFSSDSLPISSDILSFSSGILSHDLCSLRYFDTEHLKRRETNRKEDLQQSLDEL